MRGLKKIKIADDKNNKGVIFVLVFIRYLIKIKWANVKRAKLITIPENQEESFVPNKKLLNKIWSFAVAFPIIFSVPTFNTDPLINGKPIMLYRVSWIIWPSNVDKIKIFCCMINRYAWNGIAALYLA